MRTYMTIYTLYAIRTIHSRTEDTDSSIHLPVILKTTSTFGSSSLSQSIRPLAQQNALAGDWMDRNLFKAVGIYSPDSYTYVSQCS